MNSIDPAALGNHLWQSTLFALAAAGLTLFLRRNSARARYLLWLCASVKFLVPFSLLTAAGALIPWSPDPVHDAPPALIESAIQLAAPVTRWAGVPDSTDLQTDLTQRGGSAQSGNVVLTVLGMVWVLGALVVALRWLARWRPVRRALRESVPADVGFDVPVKVSSCQLEPGIVGILRPVLLLPRGFDALLTPEQMRAVLAHERCHVMWRDNLGALLHMIVEMLFWFHPLVWWIGTRLIDERERACDEQVLAEGHAAESYAEGVLKVCEHFLNSRLSCVSGVSGADLGKRIKGIMRSHLIRRLNSLQKAVLAGAALLAIITPVATGILNSPPALAQAAETLRSPSATRPDDSRKRENLETFALGSLTMAGTMKIDGGYYGLVRAPDGLVHRVLPGSYLGQNGGRIIRIEPTKISITETIPDGLGGVMQRSVGLTLAAQASQPTGQRPLVFWVSPPRTSHPQFGSISVQRDGILIQNMPLHYLIAEAYGVPLSQIEGISWWDDSSPVPMCCYSIRTSGANPADVSQERIAYELAVPGQYRPALRDFLAKEFGLVVTRTTRQVDGYVITAGSGDAKLKPTGSSPPEILRFNPGQGAEVAGYSPGEFAALLSKAQYMPFVDETRLQGKYHFDAWLPGTAGGTPAVVAKMEMQLGLHVEARRVSVDVINVVGMKVPETRN